ncbi:hypothetical protein C9I98_05150 [Photobacterium sanctipauli]|uniref:DUF4168 domain-containing protein n=1 Tax=Photobacterium sanctipauli TaxID=1342794 RepID=A0A2T3NYN3_9GAMM|nr:hypothetical protein [Photobacterium sanctipauli]PSW21328.1 hypothetical protein C9I98_05150 [Photobacterium sanctipauli]
MQNTQARVAQPSSLAVKFAKYSLPLMLVAMFALAPKANASDAATETVANQQETTHRINSIQRDLTSIRQQTLQSNPDLVEQAKAFETAYQKKAEEIGYDPNAFITKAQEIQTKVRDEATSEEERSKLIQEFADAKKAMAMQRESILADEELMAMQEKLQKDTFAAMKEQNPDTEKLVTELNELLTSLQ